MKKAAAKTTEPGLPIPCPYCGRRASYEDDQYTQNIVTVECRYACRNNVCRVNPCSEWFSSKKAALAWWNLERAKK